MTAAQTIDDVASAVMPPVVCEVCASRSDADPSAPLRAGPAAGLVLAVAAEAMLTM